MGMNMMTMCQQMMTAAAQSSSQNKPPGSSNQVGYGGGYGAVGNPNWGGAGGQPGWGAPGAPGANTGQGAQAWNKPGDWSCSCGNSNYQWRDVCNRCQKTKPKEVGAGTTPSTYGNPNWTPKPPAAAPSKETYNGRSVSGGVDYQKTETEINNFYNSIFKELK